jgi:hypothetical protein
MRLLFSIMSVTLFFVAALPIYRELSRRSDIWWTPFTMLVPLAEGADRVEIYVRREPLTALLQAGHLRLEEDHGSSVLIAFLLTYAAMCGVAAVMLLLVLTGRLAYRGEVAR